MSTVRAGAGGADSKPDRPARGSLRQAQRELTRRCIIDAAVEQFSARSALEVTVEDLARAAGVSRATVYAHFPRMSDIVAAILDDLYATGEHIFQQLAEVPEWTPASIRSWLDDVAAHYDAAAQKVRVTAVPGTVIDCEESRRRHRGYIDTIVGGQCWRGLEPEDAQQRAFMLVLIVESFFIARLTGSSPLPQGYPLDFLCETIYAILPRGRAAG